MKKTLFTVLALSLCSLAPLYAAQDNDPAMDQAKRDYRTFLEQLKELNKQYLQVSDQIREVVKDEGLPTWDTGPDVIGTDDKPASTLGGTDIKQTDKNIVVTMDLPGVDKKSIKVSLEEGKLLRVHAERNTEKEELNDSKNGQYTRVERQHGVFERVIELPAMANEKASPDARYDNGVLIISVPKDPNSKKQVAVTVH